MKLPRNLSGADLAQAMKKLGYSVTRQTGSHMRLTTQQQGEHNIKKLSLHSTKSRVPAFTERIHLCSNVQASPCYLYFRSPSSRMLKNEFPQLMTSSTSSHSAARKSRQTANTSPTRSA